MKYYTLKLDVKRPYKQCITVPCGIDFAIKAYSYIDGRPAVVFKYNDGRNTVSECVATMSSEEVAAKLIDNKAYTYTSTSGDNAWITYFIKGSNIEKTDIINVYFDRINSPTTEGSGAKTQMLNPPVRIQIEVRYVASACNSDGPDYTLNVEGHIKTNDITASNATISKNLVCGEMEVTAKKVNIKVKEKVVVGEAVLPGGQTTPLYNTKGATTLSGNILISEDLSTKPTKTSSENSIYMGDFTKYLGVEDITVNGVTYSVLCIKSV